MIPFLRRRTKRATSASVAIGTATGFVLTAACVGLLIDRGTGAPGAGVAGWTLRGPLPIDAPLGVPKRI